MSSPVMFHHLTLNPFWWMFTLLVLVIFTSAFAYKYSKQTALFWKVVDLFWILLASVGAIIIVIESNKLITSNFLKTAESSLVFQENEFYVSNAATEMGCMNKIYNQQVCNYIDKVMLPLKEVAKNREYIDQNIVIPPDTVKVDLPRFDKDKIESIHSQVEDLVVTYNESLKVVKDWQSLSKSADFDSPILSYIGSVFFLLAFSLRVGKSVADIRTEQLRVISDTYKGEVDKKTEEEAEENSKEIEETKVN
jgi:hypothetical protein